MVLRVYNLKIMAMVGAALVFAVVFSLSSGADSSVRPLTVEEQEILVSVLDRLPSDGQRDRLIGEWQRLFASHAGHVYSGLGLGGSLIRMEDGSLSVSQRFFEADPVAQEQMLLQWIN